MESILRDVIVEHLRDICSYVTLNTLTPVDVTLNTPTPVDVTGNTLTPVDVTDTG